MERPQVKSKSKTNKCTSNRMIDNVTTSNLDIALRMAGIQLDIRLIDRIIDLVELIEDKGNNTSIDDVLILKKEWAK